ncbi:MAG: hypothetical protein IJH67_01420 [Thermoguttaceae bacterium]|nr:hypothetical protein [Thermoguttaceae bacterium]
MITLEEAYKLVEVHFNELVVLKACIEFPDFWGFGVRGRQDGCLVICNAYAISKNDGKYFRFSFNDYPSAYLKKGRIVSLEELEKVMKPEDFALTKKYKEMDDMEDSQLDDEN